MNLSRWREWTVFHVFLFVTFLVSGLFVNAVQGTLFLLVGTWNRRLFRRINYYLVWLIYTQLLFLADWWSASRVVLYGSDDFFRLCGTEHALIVMNHHYELDWLYGWMVADRFGVLGNGRVFLKRVLRLAPIIGWCWSMSDVIYLDRDWDKDKQNIADGVQVHGNYPDPMVLLLFPEGTRKTADKFRASQEYAQSKGMTPFKHHLVPRTKGFVHTIQTLDPTKVTALYDVTVAVNPNHSPATFQSLMSGRTTVCDAYVRRIPTSELHGKSDAEVEKFIMDMYREKDDLIENYFSTGSFTRGGENKRFPDYPPVDKPARIGSLINVVVMNLLVGVPMVRMFLSTVLSGSLWQAALALGGVAALFAGMHKMLDLTKASKASSYGSKKKD